MLRGQFFPSKIRRPAPRGIEILGPDLLLGDWGGGTTCAAATSSSDLVFVELTNAHVSWLSVARKDSIFLRFSQDGLEASSKSTTAKLNEHEKSH